MAEKFVVFGSEMDFKAHMLERHGSEMSAKDIKEARRIEVHLGSIAQPRSSGGSRGRGRGGAPHEPSHHSSEPRPGPSRGGRRREGFGASLTTGENVAVEIQSGTATPAQNGRISPFSSAVDPEIARFVASCRVIMIECLNSSQATHGIHATSIFRGNSLSRGGCPFCNTYL